MIINTNNISKKKRNKFTVFWFIILKIKIINKKKKHIPLKNEVVIHAIQNSSWSISNCLGEVHCERVCFRQSGSNHQFIVLFVTFFQEYFNLLNDINPFYPSTLLRINPTFSPPTSYSHWMFSKSSIPFLSSGLFPEKLWCQISVTLLSRESSRF